MGKTYNVRLLDENLGIDQTIECSETQSILEVAEEQGLAVSYTCRTGSCSSCIGKVTEGTVDQSGQVFLQDEQMDQGYILTCVAFPTSDCTILINKEYDLY